MLSSLFSNIRRLRFDQSSPVQPVSGGGSTSVTEDGGGQRTEEILVSNLGYVTITTVASSTVTTVAIVYVTI